MAKAKILVTGATGGTGAPVVSDMTASSSLDAYCQPGPAP